MNDLETILKEHKTIISQKGAGSGLFTRHKPYLRATTPAAAALQFAVRQTHYEALASLLPSYEELTTIIGCISDQAAAPTNLNTFTFSFSDAETQRLLTLPQFMAGVEAACAAVPARSTWIRAHLTPLLFAALRDEAPATAARPAVAARAMTDAIYNLHDLTDQRLWVRVRESVPGAFSTNGLGTLIASVLDESPVLRQSVENLTDFYIEVCIAFIRHKIDPLSHQQQWISTDRLLVHPLYTDLNAVRAPSFVDEHRRGRRSLSSMQEANWFAPSTTKHFYRVFLDLDVETLGLLNGKQLHALDTGGGSGRRWGGLTEVFAHRAVEECAMTFDNRMDWRGFVPFILALVFRDDLSSRKYVFNLLDTEGKGKITWEQALVHVRCVTEEANDLAGLAPESRWRPEVVLGQIWDALAPANGNYLVLDDFLRAGPRTGEVISFMYDSYAFISNEMQASGSAEPDDED